MRSCIPPILAVGLSLVAAGAAADVDADKEARAQFKLGTQLFHEGEHEQAAIAFERANELKPSYKILYNIAQVEAELKHYTRALEAYTRYLDEGGAKVGRKRRAEVEEKMERLRSLVGTVAISSNADGAIVMVDGVRRGEVPLGEPISVDIGMREVVVRKDDKELHRETIRVGGKQEIVLEVNETVSEPSEVEEPVAAEEQEPAEQQDQAPPRRVWTWVAVGVAGAAGIAGGIIGGTAMSRHSDLEAACPGNSCSEDLKSDRDTVDNLSITADVLYAVTAAAAVAGIVLFFVEPTLAEKEVALVPAVGEDRVGLAIRGSF